MLPPPNLHAYSRKVTVQLLGETIVKEFPTNKRGESELQKFLDSCKDRHLDANTEARQLPRLRGKLYTLEQKLKRWKTMATKKKLETEIKLIEGKILAIQKRWAELPPRKYLRMTRKQAMDHLIESNTPMEDIILYYIDKSSIDRAKKAERDIIEYIELYTNNAIVPISNIKQQAALDEFILSLQNMY